MTLLRCFVFAIPGAVTVQMRQGLTLVDQALFHRGNCPNFEPSETFDQYVQTFLRPPDPHIFRAMSLMHENR